MISQVVTQMTQSKSKPKPKRKCVRNSTVNNTTAVGTRSGTAKKSTSLKKKVNRKNNKIIQSECIITDIENVIGPNRTVWPEYRYYQTNVTWQQGACTRLGVQFVHPTGFQPGGPDVILTRPRPPIAEKCSRRW